MRNQKPINHRKKHQHFWTITALILLALIAAFFAYTASYARADQSALDALGSDQTVSVSQTEYGYLFDGPSTDSALIFYPGGKVDERAYAQLLRQIAAHGIDVCLVKMPFHLAVFGMNRADQVMETESYQTWYIGGHSLGGAMAANYAAGHASSLRGLILLAAYPTKPLSDDLSLLSIYGTEDGVLQMKAYENGKQYWPSDAQELAIAGGNHAQFGNYGPQSGDGAAKISAAEQQKETVEHIFAFLGESAVQPAA